MKLYNRGSSYYTIITIPRCLISEYGKKQIWRSLKTKDYKLAKLRAEFETMAIRRKLLNDVESKIKAKASIPDLIDDDDEETDDIQTADQMDFSHFTDQDFLNADKDLDNFMDRKYHLLLTIYFTVQNLIRLADYNPKLYSLDNAQILSDITAENNDQSKLLTKRWLKTAWDNHRENALFIFGFVQVLLDKNGLTDIFKIKKFLTTDEITKLNLLIKEKQNLPSLFNDYMNYQENIKDILSYALYAQDKLKPHKSSNANTPLQFTSLSKLLINKHSLTPKTIEFNQITPDEKTQLIEKNCK